MKRGYVNMMDIIKYIKYKDGIEITEDKARDLCD